LRWVPRRSSAGCWPRRSARPSRSVELTELAACRAHAAKLESERGPALSKAERGLRAVEAAQPLALYDSGCAVPRAVGAVIGAVGLLLGAPTASLQIK
jgi:hypothetical protein